MGAVDCDAYVAAVIGAGDVDGDDDYQIYFAAAVAVVVDAGHAVAVVVGVDVAAAIAAATVVTAAVAVLAAEHAVAVATVASISAAYVVAPAVAILPCGLPAAKSQLARRFPEVPRRHPKATEVASAVVASAPNAHASLASSAAHLRRAIRSLSA